MSPFHSVGCERGTLQAVIADVMTIRGNGRQWQYKNAVIGIYPGHFQKSGQYRAILHRDVIASAVPLSSGKRKKKRQEDLKCLKNVNLSKRLHSKNAPWFL